MMPDAGALLKLADEIERSCKAPTYEVRLGTIEGKMVVAALHQAASQGGAMVETGPVTVNEYEDCVRASQGRAEGEQSEVRTEELWAGIRQRDANINAAFAGLNAIEEQLHEMRSLKGWRLNLIRENLEKTKAALRTPTVAQEASDCGAEIKRLRAQVEYWRLAAERREARMERSGVDVAEASTLDAPSVPSADREAGK